jgi:hypothetical protein
MPSLHLCWATWCAAVLFPGLRHRWSRALAVSYPVVTAVVVVVTGNHYVLDLVGGVACLLIGVAVTHVLGAGRPRPAGSSIDGGDGGVESTVRMPATPAPALVRQRAAPVLQETGCEA